MEKEIWKDVINYEGRYDVSNYGRVKSHVSSYNGGTLLTKKTIILKQYKNKGYFKVTLRSSNGKSKAFFVHFLVNTMFNGHGNGLFTNHIDGIKCNNYYKNLEWVTRSENQKHAYRIGLQRPIDNGFKKPIAVYHNGIFVNNHVSIREVSRTYNLDRRSIQRVLIGKFKHCKNYTFKQL